MTKGENIVHAIYKEVSRFSFVKWLEEWGIDEADFDKFMQAGKNALTESEEE